MDPDKPSLYERLSSFLLREPEDRDQLMSLLERAGIAVKCYASAFVFLAELNPDHRGCLLLDVNMPGMTGLELQAVLAKRGIRLERPESLNASPTLARAVAGLARKGLQRLAPQA